MLELIAQPETSMGARGQDCLPEKKNVREIVMSRSKKKFDPARHAIYTRKKKRKRD